MPARSEFVDESKMEKSISDLLVISSIAALAVTCLGTDVVRTDGMLMAIVLLVLPECVMAGL